MESFEYPFYGHRLQVHQSPKGLVEMSWKRGKAKKSLRLSAAQKTLVKQLDAFMAGHSDLQGVSLDWKNLQGTAFQKQVWKRMSQIPLGETLSYGELAQELSRPGAARAVGTACGKNPVILVIPCHRVVGKGGLGGFSGGGLSVKKRLLALEGHVL